jgi:hypothetical protein
MLEAMAQPPAGGKGGRLKSRLLVYVDVLGVTEKILKDDILGFAVPMAYFQGFLTGLVERKSRRAQKHFPKEKTLQASTFSDTFAISCAADADRPELVIGLAQSICTSLWASGNYTRGAVTLDSLLHYDRVITGRGLVEAHLLERDVAKYPRILVTDQAAALLMSGPRNRLQIRDDFDGLKTLEVFAVAPYGERSQSTHDAAKQAREMVQRDLKATQRRPMVANQALALNRRAKYQWMLDYLDQVLGATVATGSDKPW